MGKPGANRKSLGNISHSDFLNSSKLIESIDKVNKLKKINLIVVNLDKVIEIQNILEKNKSNFRD